MNPAQLFQYVLIAIIVFMAVLTIAGRRRWITPRDFGACAIVLFVSAIVMLSRIALSAMKSAPTETKQYELFAELVLPFPVITGVAMFIVWRRLVRDEAALKANPPKAVKGEKTARTARSGPAKNAQPQASASELRKRKKKRQTPQ